MYRPFFSSFVRQFATPGFFVVLMIFFGFFLRFYNLNWGAPFYFHPDERNIASSVSQLVWPVQMNPHFFAYGSLPIYAIFFTGRAAQWLQCTMYKVQCTNSITFESAMVVSRFYSGVFSVLLIPLLYGLGKKLKDERTGLLAGFLGLMSVGFIQFAHFGTFEMWLTIESVGLFYVCLWLLEKHRWYYPLLLGLLLGISVATKVSQIALLPLPILGLFWQCCGGSGVFGRPQGIAPTDNDKNIISVLRDFLTFLRESLLVLAVGLFVYFLTNPYVVLDFPSFVNSMHYESSVALGTMKVFYTGEFLHSVPVLFPFLYDYPFLLNPLLTCALLFSFVYVVMLFIKKLQVRYLFLLFFYLVLFLSEAFFYVKWTRYLVPTLPFVYLMIALLFSSAWLRRRVFAEVLVVVMVLVTTLFALAFFVTDFVRPDTRVAAAQWAKSAIPADAEILSEVYDLGITPFNDRFHHITLFNFYDLENSTSESNALTLQEALASNSYIILPSQRILKLRMLDQQDFPQGHAFYQSLLNGSLGYKKIYESSCDVLCMISYFGSPIYRYEETANVFDRPEVEVFQKL